MASNKRKYFDVRDVFVSGKSAATSTLNDTTGNVFFVKLSSSVVLIGLTHPAVLHFQGILSIKCVYGKIDCLGHQISKENGNMNKEFTVFSLLDRSAMYLSTFEGVDEDSCEIDALKEFDIECDKIGTIIKRVGNQGAIVLASSKLDAYRHWDNVLQSANLSVFPRNERAGPSSHRDIEDVLDCVIGTADDPRINSRILPHSSWAEVSDQLKGKENLKVLIYGGKGVGKSTVLKYLINKCRRDEAIFIDLDVGQSEFTICGSVSAVSISRPLLGSNFTNLEVPMMSYHLGAIDVSQCLGLYIECVQNIIQFCEEIPIDRRAPWFFNTMGMHKGIGAQLLAKIISIVRPNHVIEVKSSRSDDNFPYSFSDSRVNELFPLSDLMYTFHTIHSNTPLLAKSPMNPVSLRNIFAYVHFSKILSMRSLKRVKFCRVTETQHAGLALGDVVALTRDSPSGDCLGYGLVAKLNSENSIVGIVSPLQNDDIEVIDTILRTNINLKALSLLQGFKTLEGPVSHFSRFDTSKIRRKNSKVDLYKVLFSTDY